jgi:hypothetical protein
MGETKVDETIPSETKSKKMVSRSVAIALGIVCILLIAGLGGAMVYYTMIVNDKTSQINELNETLNLGKSIVWYNNYTISQPASDYTAFWWYAEYRNAWVGYLADLPYSGYMSVQVLSSTNSNTYVRAFYSVKGINYDNQKNVGSSGTAVFPIVAPANLTIYVGNINHADMYNHTVTTTTVTITYHY